MGERPLQGASAYLRVTALLRRGDDGYLRTMSRSPSRKLTWLVRAGFMARGLTYGIIGALALSLSLGHGGETTNQQGALQLLAAQPLGAVALAVAAAGLLAYAVWKLGQAAYGRGPEGGGGGHWTDRLSNLAAGLIYIGFFVVAASVLLGRAGNPSSEQRSAAAGVLSWPGGRLLVAGCGAVLVLVALSQIREGITDRFYKQLKTAQIDRRFDRVFRIAGRIGLPARAVVFAVVGWFLVRTAIDYDPNKAIGVDGALRELAHQTYGSWLLGFVAAGLIAFALFSFAEGVYRRL